MSVEKEIVGSLVAVENAQRHSSETELLARATTLVDKVRELRDHVTIDVLIRGRFAAVAIDDWLLYTLDVLGTAQIELAEHGRIRALLSLLWVSRSPDAQLGYLIRIDGQNYRISPRASYRTT